MIRGTAAATTPWGCRCTGGAHLPRPKPTCAALAESLTRRNPNPYGGEPFYNLGLALKMQGRHAEAKDAFYRAAWSAAWQDAACFQLARLACRAGQLTEAVALTGEALARNGRHYKARHLRAALLRRLGQAGEARAETEASLSMDPLEFGGLWERRLLLDDPAFERLARGVAHTYVEIALDYIHAGLYPEAAGVLAAAPQDQPMVLYYAGWCQSLSGDEAAASALCRAAAALPPDTVFPNRLECVLALQNAMRLDPGDARAPYYLGNFWYAHRRHAEAVACWERARDLDGGYPTVHRNLGLAYYNKLHDVDAALRSYERAFALDPGNGRVYFELDQLYRRLNRSPEERLTGLQAHTGLVAQRDDLALEEITLLNLAGRADEALERLMARKFHPWEGGEGRVTGQYVLALVEQARQAIEQGAYAEAVARLERAQVYPESLGEGKLYGTRENHIFYYLGCAYAGLGENVLGQAYLERAATGTAEPASPMYYNDQSPDMIFYQGLARLRLGREAEAQEIFRKLVDYGTAAPGRSRHDGLLCRVAARLSGLRR